MKSYTASDARRCFGRLLKTVLRQPVLINKNGRAPAVVISASDDGVIAAVRGS